MTEPIFRMSPNRDPDVVRAHALASERMPEFLLCLAQEAEATHMAKLRFRDPDLSEKLGQDRFFYLWLSAVVFHPEEGLLSGELFEVPSGFEKWHPVGSRLAFEPDDVFDWMVITEGCARGGFTVRLTRSRLPDAEKEAYDSYIGVSSYEPINGVPSGAKA